MLSYVVTFVSEGVVFVVVVFEVDVVVFVYADLVLDDDFVPLVVFAVFADDFVDLLPPDDFGINDDLDYVFEDVFDDFLLEDFLLEDFFCLK